MLKTGESLIFGDDPPVFTDIIQDKIFNLEKFSDKIVLLSFVEFSGGWEWFRQLAAVYSAFKTRNEFCFITVFFQAGPRMLTGQDILDRISSDPGLKDKIPRDADNFLTTVDHVGTSSMNDKYAMIYANYIINDSPDFNFQSPGYKCYTYIASGGIICDKWHTNCTAFKIQGTLEQGSPFVKIDRAAVLSAGDSVSGPCLPGLVTVKSVDTPQQVTLNKNSKETAENVELVIGSGDPVSFNRMIIDSVPLFNSRDFTVSGRYVSQRLCSLVLPLRIERTIPGEGDLVNSLEKIEVCFSKPLTEPDMSAMRFRLSGEGASGLLVKNVDFSGKNLIENTVTLYIAGNVRPGEIILIIETIKTGADEEAEVVASYTAFFCVDIEPPVIGSFINHSGNTVSQRIINFTLTAADNFQVTHWVVNECAAPPEKENPLWHNAQAEGSCFTLHSEYNISETEGPKEIYAWVRDAAGNVNVLSDLSFFHLRYDTRVPVVTMFSRSGDGPTNERMISFTLAGLDDKEVTGWKITESIDQPQADDGGWVDFIPSCYSFSTGKSGTMRLYAWAKDRDGNVSSACRESIIEIEYDIDPPVITAFSSQIKDPVAYRKIPVPVFEAADTTGIAGWMITQKNEQPLASDSCWLDSKPETFEFKAEGSSLVKLYAWAKDKAGNVSRESPGSKLTIAYDIDPPVINEFFPANYDPQQHGFVKIGRLRGSDNTGIVAWMITQTVQRPGADDERWQWKKPSEFMISSHRDCRVTLYAWAKDRAGNVSFLTENSCFTVQYLTPKPSLRLVSVSGNVELAGNDSLVFNDTLAGEQASMFFTIENTGKADLVVMDVTITGGRMFRLDSRFKKEQVIRPGEGPVTFGVQFSPSDLKPYKASLNIQSNDPASKKRSIHLSGRGVAALSVLAETRKDDTSMLLPVFNADTFDMGKGTEGADIVSSMRITNISMTDVNIRGITVTSASSRAFRMDSLPGLPAKLVPGGMLIVNVVFTPKEDGRNYEARLCINSDDKACKSFRFTVVASSSEKSKALNDRADLKKTVTRKTSVKKAAQADGTRTTGKKAVLTKTAAVKKNAAAKASKKTAGTGTLKAEKKAAVSVKNKPTKKTTVKKGIKPVSKKTPGTVKKTAKVKSVVTKKVKPVKSAKIQKTVKVKTASVKAKSAGAKSAKKEADNALKPVVKKSAAASVKKSSVKKAAITKTKKVVKAVKKKVR